MSQEQHVVAVVVTWNRRDLLAEALRAALTQSRPPDRLVVVDNASTDGTDDMLHSAFPTVETLRTSRNLGGAGGFALGIRQALDAGPCDLVWLMDDDTVAQPDALGALLAARSSYAGEKPVLMASRVVWTDGRDHPMNTPRVRPYVSRKDLQRAAACGCFPVRSASFVSILVDADVVRARGLPIADYFLWNDDFEFTTRIVRGNVALACPASVVVHKTTHFGSTDIDPGSRFFYEVRNKVWLYTRSRGLGPREKVAYAAATALRWARTIARSHDRRTLLAGLGRGLARGFLSAPRPTGLVISDEPVPEKGDGPRG